MAYMECMGLFFSPEIEMVWEVSVICLTLSEMNQCEEVDCS